VKLIRQIVLTVTWTELKRATVASLAASTDTAHVQNFDLLAYSSQRWRSQCVSIDANNIGDFRSMARRRLPGPIFHYIDGAADDEVTYRRNTEAYERCDLVPNVLAGVEIIDMSVTVMGQKLDMPLFCSPTALQRLFHHDGERAVAKAAKKFGTMFGVSSLGTVRVEEIGSTIRTPKLFQLYFHKDRGLTNNMIERCIAANFDVLALTVDTITGHERKSN
jgi:L-lactate dehydrogenase (cytochrome)